MAGCLFPCRVVGLEVMVLELVGLHLVASLLLVAMPFVPSVVATKHASTQST